MGLFKAIGGAVGGTLGDQWKDVISADTFDELTVIKPGVLRSTNKGRGSNTHGSQDIISNGSVIYIPENTAAFVLSQDGIENLLVDPGGYQFQEGQESIFAGGGIGGILSDMANRVGFGGISPSNKRICFINLREIRGIKYGTKGPQLYHDLFYDVDLEITSYGSYALKVTNPEVFLKNFVPAKTTEYSFASKAARAQISSEFTQSFIAALNRMSKKYRISELASYAEELADNVELDKDNAGTWEERFGFKVTKVAVESIEFTEASRQIINRYTDNRLSVTAYENLSEETANMAAQQKMADGVKEHGLGDGGGAVLGMNVAQMMNNPNSSKEESIDSQIDKIHKLKGLLDEGLLTQEEFDKKKKEILNL